MKRLTKTSIEYGDLAWNFYPGCLHWQTGICPVGKNCWAKKIAEHYRNNYPEGFEPRLVPELLLAPLAIKKPAKILVNFMGDLGGEWVNPEVKIVLGWPECLPTGYTLKTIIRDVLNACPQHTFIFLTKNPAAWRKWNLWPDNAWVGATVCNAPMFDEIRATFPQIEAKHKWISLEPLLAWGAWNVSGLTNALKDLNIDWLVIGAQTRPDVMPKIEWVREIVEAADAAAVKVWLKDNLRPLLLTDDDDPHYEKPFCRYLPDQGNGDCYDGHSLRQEWPE